MEIPGNVKDVVRKSHNWQNKSTAQIESRRIKESQGGNTFRYQGASAGVDDLESRALRPGPAGISLPEPELQVQAKPFALMRFLEDEVHNNPVYASRLPKTGSTKPSVSTKSRTLSETKIQTMTRCPEYDPNNARADFTAISRRNRSRVADEHLACTIVCDHACISLQWALDDPNNDRGSWSFRVELQVKAAQEDIAMHAERCEQFYPRDHLHELAQRAIETMRRANPPLRGNSSRVESELRTLLGAWERENLRRQQKVQTQGEKKERHLQNLKQIVDHLTQEKRRKTTQVVVDPSREISTLEAGEHCLEAESVRNGNRDSAPAATQHTQTTKSSKIQRKRAAMFITQEKTEGANVDQQDARIEEDDGAWRPVPDKALAPPSNEVISACVDNGISGASSLSANLPNKAQVAALLPYGDFAPPATSSSGTQRGTSYVDTEPEERSELDLAAHKNASVERVASQQRSIEPTVHDIQDVEHSSPSRSIKALQPNPGLSVKPAGSSTGHEVAPDAKAILESARRPAPQRIRIRPPVVSPWAALSLSVLSKPVVMHKDAGRDVTEDGSKSDNALHICGNQVGNRQNLAVITDVQQGERAKADAHMKIDMPRTSTQDRRPSLLKLAMTNAALLQETFSTLPAAPGPSLSALVDERSPSFLEAVRDKGITVGAVSVTESALMNRKRKRFDDDDDDGRSPSKKRQSQEGSAESNKTR